MWASSASTTPSTLQNCRGSQDTVAGHTVINSIAAITRLSSDEIYQLYGQSTNRALVFTNVTRGESPLVALRVVSPTPYAVTSTA